jgi:hypothetical protein
MKTFTLMAGMLLALFLGICIGMSPFPTKRVKYVAPGYTVIEAGIAVDHKGDTISVTRGFSRDFETTNK